MNKFKVELDLAASSPNPQIAIWNGGHICVSENYQHDQLTERMADDSVKCGESIIKYQLAGDRGHYSCLNMAFVKLNCFGFPHSTVMQMVRHRDSAYNDVASLVQSGRYTGARFIAVEGNYIDIEDVFYLRPPGVYRDRDGQEIVYTDEMRFADQLLIRQCCERYAYRVFQGMPYEMAREIIPYCFRQDFTISGTLEAVWHILDQRTKMDAELEVRVLADKIIETLMSYAPELMQWYVSNRYKKAKLAP